MSNERFKGFGFDLEDNRVPVAVVLPEEQEVVVGSVAKLDGRSSVDPDGDGLTFNWSFTQTPIGSQVNIVGFTHLEDDASIVSFAPDLTGTYKVQLIVSDGSLDSDPTEVIVDVRVILVPHHQGIIPDASFIWNYLSDFWTQVPDKNIFETFWSAAIQVTASQLLKLYQYQYNKSIRDIQDLIQKRWISFSPALQLDRTKISFILADDTAGTSASTFVTDPTTGLPSTSQPDYSNVVTVPLTEGSFVNTAYQFPIFKGRLLQLGDRTFTLARANQIFQAIDYAKDGLTMGTLAFAGSGFTTDMVGDTLRIIGPPGTLIIGDYLIDSVSDASHLTISNPPSVVWDGHADLEYVVLPVIPDHSSFFADQAQVPTKLENQTWRLSSTLISSEFDFEQQGVSAGDLIEVEITRVDLQVLSTFYAQVISVDRNRLGFALNLTDLVAGTAAPGITDDIQVTLATDLIVPGLTAQVNGTLVYDLAAGDIHDTVTSIIFKRQYFETELDTDTEIDVGPFTILARPVQILRNRKISVDETIVSIPILQEYIKQPNVLIEGKDVFFINDNVKQPVSREPYLLSENLDYIIDDESTITGSCSLQQGIDEITVPFGDLIDRSVQEGDTLEISVGITVEVYTVLRVVAADTLRVSPTPVVTSSAALFTLSRRIPGKFIRFVDKTFSKTQPAPTRFWAEVVYLDNSDAIEGNFGILVGVKREDLARVGSAIPYKSAVAGLMYALTNGPTISNLTLSAQILLGLPFAQNTGVITEIDPDFKKRDDGSPSFGRILISERDRDGNPTGITNIYLYPQGRQIFDTPSNTWVPAIPDFSGLALNPDTGVEYTIGDTVSQFAPLSKGAQIQEYLTTPDWIDNLIAQGDIASMLRKYHSFQLLVNDDLVTSTDIDLVAQFMQKVKAHYVLLTSGLLKSLEDFVDPTDAIFFGRVLSFFDSADMGVPTAAKLDEDDDDEAILTINGYFHTRYLVGTDLITTQGSAAVSSEAGGFINARTLLLESFDPPLLRAGDILVIRDGSNAGKYVVASVDDDQNMTLNLDGAVFETDDHQSFIVYRSIKNPIWLGKVAVTTGDGLVATQEVVGTAAGIGAAGASVGDHLVFTDLTTLNPAISKVYTIVQVVPDLASPHLVIIPDPVEVTGRYDGWLIREGLMTSGHISPPGSTGDNFYVTATAFTSIIQFVDTGSHVNSWLNVCLIRPGTEVIIDNIPYEVMRLDAANRRVVVTPPLLASYVDKQVTINLRPQRSPNPVSVDFLDRVPGDFLELDLVSSTISGDDAQTSSGSTDVTLTVETFVDLNVVPGDFLVLLEGADSTRDVGDGSGIFPIKEIIGGTIARLMDQLTDTGNFRYGIRRKVPNEG